MMNPAADWPDAVFGVARTMPGVRQVYYVPDNGHRRLIERCHADNAMLHHEVDRRGRGRLPRLPAPGSAATGACC